MDLEKWNVYEWLEKAGLSQYAESFVDNGYDTPDLCAELQNDDLTAIGVTNKKHRSVLFSNARELLEQLKKVEEATDAPMEEEKKALSPAVINNNNNTAATSPTSPANIGGGEYSEPWHSKFTQPWARGGGGTSGGGHANGVGRLKMKKTNSGEKPPLPPPNKHKKKQPPPSPIATDLPTFKREGPDTGLTKLQLQLKIREELRAEGIVLSEPPYVDEGGKMCSQPLLDLAEHYGNKLKLQPLDIHDALFVIWNSENSFVTPLTPVQDPAHSHQVILRGSSAENYDEPFDATGPVALTPDAIKQQYSPKEGSPRGAKSHTLPPANVSSGNYDEPFDAVSKLQSPSENVVKMRADATQSSKTLPSPKLKLAAEEKDKKKSSAGDRESSPKHSGLSKLFRRKEKRRSHSIQEYDMKQREDKKSTKKEAKISFPSMSSAKTAKGQNGRASPYRESKHKESSSDTEDSPRQTKKHSGVKFKKFVTPPTLKRNEQMDALGSSSSSVDSTPETVRKLRAIRSRGLTGSDLEISFQHVSDEDGNGKSWLVASKSFDNLNDVHKEKTIEKKKGGMNIFSKIFKARTLQSPSRKKTKQKSKKKSSNRSSLADEVTPSPNEGESSLASSMSMPDIASVSPDKKKKNRKPFVSSSHTPPEQLSDIEDKSLNKSSPQHLGVSETTTVIPVPKPRSLARAQSPNSDVLGQSLVGGSAPVKPSYLNKRGPSPEPSKTPSSGGSKNQSPLSSASDISSSPKLGGRKPIPPPKPRIIPPKLSSLDDSLFESQKSLTLPLNKIGRTSSAGSNSPPKPMKQVSVPHDGGRASRGVVAAGDIQRSPPKPRRNFTPRANSELTSDRATLSKKTNGGGSVSETPPSSGPGHEAEPTSKMTPPSARQRPPPKPARSIKRKPVRERVNHDDESQTPSKVEQAEADASANRVEDESSKKVANEERHTPSHERGGVDSGVSSNPPKPIRRIKSPKVIDSSSPGDDEKEKKKKSRTFDGEHSRSSSNEMTTKPTPISRTLNVSTPSPTSSSPTTNEGINVSLAEAAAIMHDVSATTAELSKSAILRERFDSGSGSPKAGKPKLMPKPRVLQVSTKTIGGSGSTAAGNGTPNKPIPPTKPARHSIRMPSPDHS